MADRPELLPQYRFRGSVAPSAEVSRPVAVTMTQRPEGDSAAASATLDIFDCIDSYGGWWGISARDVDAALAQIGDVQTLYVRLNSPGGEATEGVAIANLLRAHPATVRMTVYGMAASAASIIATAGDHLSMAPGAVLMVHDASGFGFGTAVDLQAAVNGLNAVSDAYASLYALKAGGTVEQWRATMRQTTWYTPEAAVAAKLADAVGLDPSLPGQLPDVEADDDDVITVELDIEINPAARALARRSDLSFLPIAAMAPQTPAEPPVTPPTTTKEADTMSDTLSKGLRERLGVADDADEATILAALDEALTEQVEPTATHTSGPVDVKALTAALEADGKVVVSKARFDALADQAAEGAKARATQIERDREELIDAAMSAGKISRDDRTREVWAKEFARDFNSAKADLESLPARFPVGSPKGHQADGEVDADNVMSDAQADALAAQFGVSKEALLHG